MAELLYNISLNTYFQTQDNDPLAQPTSQHRFPSSDGRLQLRRRPDILLLMYLTALCTK